MECSLCSSSSKQLLDCPEIYLYAVKTKEWKTPDMDGGGTYDHTKKKWEKFISAITPRICVKCVLKVIKKTAGFSFYRGMIYGAIPALFICLLFLLPADDYELVAYVLTALLIFFLSFALHQWTKATCLTIYSKIIMGHVKVGRTKKAVEYCRRKGFGEKISKGYLEISYELINMLLRKEPQMMEKYGKDKGEKSLARIRYTFHQKLKPDWPNNKPKS